ncbi:YIP1 family protein [Candidatus Woesearchaeota archaeon]|nr:YIP1 family protein [Candidatus Woesearchaeota archaeon]
MDIFHVIKRVVTEPTAFFRNVGKGKEQLGFAFGYFALLSLVSTLFGLLASLTFFSAFFPLMQNMMSIIGANFPGLFTSGALVRNALFSYVFGLGLSFVYAGLLHVWILLFGGKQRYGKTYELGAYAGTPAMLLGWIPFLGFAGQIWSLILLIIGTQGVHGISRAKAIAMYVIPLVLAFFLMLLFMVFLLSTGILNAFLGGLQ